MFKVSMKGEYALRAVLHLAKHETVCTTEDIAKTQLIPRPFLKKIISSLRVAGLITSVKGKKGGVVLNVSPQDISFRSVLEKIEGPIFLNTCLVHKGACERDQTCPMHEVWQKCQEAIRKIMESQNFGDLVKREKQLLKREKSAKSKKAALPLASMALVPKTT